MVTEYFESFKSDNIILKNQNNAIWVVSKTKVHINKYPTWRDIIYGRRIKNHYYLVIKSMLNYLIKLIIIMNL